MCVVIVMTVTIFDILSDRLQPKPASLYCGWSMNAPLPLSPTIWGSGRTGPRHCASGSVRCLLFSLLLARCGACVGSRSVDRMLMLWSCS